MASGQNSVTFVSFTSTLKARISAGRSEGCQSCFEWRWRLRSGRSFSFVLGLRIKGQKKGQENFPVVSVWHVLSLEALITDIYY